MSHSYVGSPDPLRVLIELCSLRDGPLQGGSAGDHRRDQWLSWPCGAKKPTRHPLRRPSSAELFGAIATPLNKENNYSLLIRQY